MVRTAARPFIVFTMGKVGSMTVHTSLQATGAESHHCHALSNPIRRAAFETKERLYALKRLRIPFYVITLVREPVARNISAFFENRQTNYPATLDEFLAYDHTVPLTWLDDELYTTFGVDVYKQTFDKEQGWRVYDNILLMRMEDLDRVWADAFQALTGNEAPPLIRSNVNRKRDYLRFCSDVTIPQDYIDTLHNSKYYRHFYD